MFPIFDFVRTGDVTLTVKAIHYRLGTLPLTMRSTSDRFQFVLGTDCVLNLLRRGGFPDELFPTEL